MVFVCDTVDQKNTSWIQLVFVRNSQIPPALGLQRKNTSVVTQKYTIRLQPLHGLTPFMDIFFFGYLHQIQFVSKCGQIFCTTREEGGAKEVVAQITLLVQEAFVRSLDSTKCGYIGTNTVQNVMGQGAIEGRII